MFEQAHLEELKEYGDHKNEDRWRESQLKRECGTKNVQGKISKLGPHTGDRILTMT
jgi:hypothetical protein